MKNIPGELSSIIDGLWIEIIISDEHRLLLQTANIAIHAKSQDKNTGVAQISSTMTAAKRVLVRAADIAEVNVDVSKKRHAPR